MLLQRRPASALAAHVEAYWGYDSRAAEAKRLREGPGRSVVVNLSFGTEWLIDGEPRESFVGGLRTSQVTAEHTGDSVGLQIDIVPWAAFRLLRMPMHELAETTVPLDRVLPTELVARLAEAQTWGERFTFLDNFLGPQFATGPVVPRELVWAWTRLRTTHGCVRVGTIAGELGWSRKRFAATFREQLGLTPKAVARLLRFERARRLVGTMSWGQLAATCGYFDQSHLIAEFRAFSGETPETFFQDDAAITP